MAIDRPNIVLICVDQWRADCLGSAGHPIVQTPYLDQLANQGARFDRAYAATPSCIAARASLLTGMIPRRHGRVGYQEGIPWDYSTTLAGEFTRHGYQTQAVGKMHVHPARERLGFENVILHDGYTHFSRKRGRTVEERDDYLPWLRQRSTFDTDVDEHGLHCNSYAARPWPLAESLHPTNFVTTQSIDFLRRRDPRKPFFLFMSYHRPHPPLDPPQWAFEQYLHRPMPDPPVGDWADPVDNRTCAFSLADAPEPTRRAAFQQACAGYFGHLTHIDHQIHRFFERLIEYDLRQNTWICFVSDHGEMLGDHRLFAKVVPYEGSARVPLILQGPTDSGIQPGRSHNHVIELRDIMATLLDCASLPIPDDIDGRSFLPAARGDEQPLRPYLHGEHTFGTTGSHHYITDQTFKYIWFSHTGHEQLFNLKHDPQELHNLASDSDHQETCTQLRQHLIHELRGREEGFTDGNRLIAGRPVTPYLTQVLNAPEQK